MGFVLMTDSTCDLPPTLVEDLSLQVIPLIYSLDGTEYYHYADNHELNIHTFYQKISQGSTPSTAQISPAEFREAFEPVLQAGNDILYIAFSGGISGTAATASMVAKELLEEYSERHLIVYDSLCASGGEGLLVYHAAKLKEEGKTLQEIIAWLEENRLHLVHWFTVDDLQALKRGGRITGAAALLGGMLGIKPILHVDNDGHLVPVEKVRGRRKALERLIDHMEESIIDASNQTVFINHADRAEEAKYVAEEIHHRLKVKKVIIHYIGPLIGAHSGPGTMALFFLGTKR